jgi:hypothetical protein
MPVQGKKTVQHVSYVGLIRRMLAMSAALVALPNHKTFDYDV